MGRRGTRGMRRALFDRPKDIEGCSAAPEEFLPPLFLLCSCFCGSRRVCVCVCVLSVCVYCCCCCWCWCWCCCCCCCCSTSFEIAHANNSKGIAVPCTFVCSLWQGAFQYRAGPQHPHVCVGGCWVGLGEGLTWSPTHGPRRLPCRTRPGGCTRVSGHKAYRTADRPQTPRWRSRAGDAAVPVCMCPCVFVEGGGLVWFGSRPVPDALAHSQHSPLCQHDWARRIAVVRSQGLPDC